MDTDSSDTSSIFEITADDSLDDCIETVLTLYKEEMTNALKKSTSLVSPTSLFKMHQAAMKRAKIRLEQAHKAYKMAATHDGVDEETQKFEEKVSAVFHQFEDQNEAANQFLYEKAKNEAIKNFVTNWTELGRKFDCDDCVEQKELREQIKIFEQQASKKFYDVLGLRDLGERGFIQNISFIDEMAAIWTTVYEIKMAQTKRDLAPMAAPRTENDDDQNGGPTQIHVVGDDSTDLQLIGQNLILQQYQKAKEAAFEQFKNDCSIHLDKILKSPSSSTPTANDVKVIYQKFLNDALKTFRTSSQSLHRTEDDPIVLEEQGKINGELTKMCQAEFERWATIYRQRSKKTENLPKTALGWFWFFNGWILHLTDGLVILLAIFVVIRICMHAYMHGTTHTDQELSDALCFWVAVLVVRFWCSVWFSFPVGVMDVLLFSFALFISVILWLDYSNGKTMTYGRMNSMLTITGMASVRLFLCFWFPLPFRNILLVTFRIC